MLYFDTYAILALLRGSRTYDRVRDTPGITHQMNHLEAVVHLMRRGEKDPWRMIDALGLGLVAADRGDIDAAARLKSAADRARKNLSYVDALGYALARGMGYRFLTGDQEFRDLPEVEFVPES